MVQPIAQRIDKLRQKQAQLKEQERKLEASLKNKERKTDTRRKILAGSWLLDAVSDDPDLKAQLKEGLQSFLKSERDRDIFFDILK
jgi:septal ring factor EnvC (AmiA/AmiB activator)